MDPLSAANLIFPIQRMDNNLFNSCQMLQIFIYDISQMVKFKRMVLIGWLTNLSRTDPSINLNSELSSGAFNY